jgi:adenosylmethionine-8-amino-7-oxononanoate aminotransferase
MITTNLKSIRALGGERLSTQPAELRIRASRPVHAAASRHGSQVASVRGFGILRGSELDRNSAGGGCVVRNRRNTRAQVALFVLS